jgi:hypothetical protein
MANGGRRIIFACLLLGLLGGIAYCTSQLVSFSREWVGAYCVVHGARLVDVQRDTCHRRLAATATTSPHTRSSWLSGLARLGSLPLPSLVAATPQPQQGARRRLHFHHFMHHSFHHNPHHLHHSFHHNPRHLHTHKGCVTDLRTVYQPTFSVSVVGLDGLRVDACEHPSCSSGEQTDKDAAGGILDRVLDGACTKKVGYAKDNISAWLPMDDGVRCDPSMLAGPNDTATLPHHSGPANETAAPDLGGRYCACSTTYRRLSATTQRSGPIVLN